MPHTFGQSAPAPLAATLRPAVLPETPRTPPHEAAPVPRRATVPQRAVVAAAEPVAMTVAASVPAPPAPAASGETAATPPTAAAGASSRETMPDAEGIRSYRIGLAREARANKRYPLLARERGWAGVSEVQVEVSREGLPRQTLLARSSGHELLDREALDLMARAAAATAPPESLRGRAFTVRLPVVFELEEK